MSSSLLPLFLMSLASFLRSLCASCESPCGHIHIYRLHQRVCGAPERLGSCCSCLHRCHLSLHALCAHLRAEKQGPRRSLQHKFCICHAHSGQHHVPFRRVQVPTTFTVGASCPTPEHCRWTRNQASTDAHASMLPTACSARRSAAAARGRGRCRERSGASTPWHRGERAPRETFRAPPHAPGFLCSLRVCACTHYDLANATPGCPRCFSTARG